MVFLSCAYAGAQERPAGERMAENGAVYYLHTVRAGETLYSISKRYQASLEEVRRVNPYASEGIRPGDLLKIPAGPERAAGTVSPQAGEARIILHKVQRKETLYFISRKYGVTIDDILSYNPGLSQLKRGETIRIPQWGSAPMPGAKPHDQGEKGTHWVQPGETLYSISRRYGVAVTALLEENPQARELKSGMRLTIPGRSSGDSADVSHTPAHEEYITHTIQPGETLYSLSKRYGVSAERLVELNPSLDRSFRSGNEIRVPRMGTAPAVPDREESDRVAHVVAPGETLFSISGKYGIAMGELVAANPVLEGRPPRTGDTLLIRLPENPLPAETDAETLSRSADCMVKKSYHNTPEVRVALLLPLFIDANRYLNTGFLSGKNEEEDHGEESTGTVSHNEKYISFQGNSENFLHFYEGALLAVDSLRQMGIRIKLDVFDTEQKPSRVRTLVSSGDLANADVIIGPVFPNEQKEISDFAREKKIVVVSPLSASDEVTRNNPWFFQINPPREHVAEKTVEYIAATYPHANLVVLQTGNSSAGAEKEAELLRKEITRRGSGESTAHVRVVDYRKEGFTALKAAMAGDRKNIIVLTSDSEAEVSVAVSNMKMLAREFDVTLIGNNRFPQFDSINPENFHAGRLEFLTPYWPDTRQQVTRSFISRFRSFFKGDPNQFSMQGYDAVFFFAKAVVDFGSDFRQCIPSASAGLVQGNYRFDPRPAEGAVNDGLIVVHYTSDFQVIRKN